MNIKRVTYKTYAGIVIYGDKPVAVPEGVDKNKHFYRAVYLTSQLEAPTWGTVQGYDGCGISCGIFHFIAKYPRQNTQGPLFNFISFLVKSKLNNKNIQALLSEFDKVNWYLDLEKGILKNKITHSIIGGNEIMNIISPINGTVPASGPKRVQAEQWAIKFHNVCSDPELYDSQIKYCIDYLIKGYDVVERQVYENLLKSCLVLGPDLLVGKNGLTEEQDLALCFYHSASVNAPAVAVRGLKSVISTDDHFPAALIKTIGTIEYGQFKDNLSNTSRYDRARKAAMKSGLWGQKLFGPSGIMPENF